MHNERSQNSKTWLGHFETLLRKRKLSRQLVASYHGDLISKTDVERRIDLLEKEKPYLEAKHKALVKQEEVERGKLFKEMDIVRSHGPGPCGWGRKTTHHVRSVDFNVLFITISFWITYLWWLWWLFASSTRHFCVEFIDRRAGALVPHLPPNLGVTKGTLAHVFCHADLSCVCVHLTHFSSPFGYKYRSFCSLLDREWSKSTILLLCDIFLRTNQQQAVSTHSIRANQKPRTIGRRL